MTESATITLTTGPDRGKILALSGELMHVGRGPQNHVVLDSSTVSDHVASILNRDGRYAIFTPLERVVEIDGSVIPAKRWVWLHNGANVQIGESTAFQFESAAMESPTGNGGISRGDTAVGPASSKTQRSDKRSNQRRQVARFITDQPDEHLVSLGENGQLPELTLTEGTSKKAVENAGQQQSPIVVYCLVAMSFCLSIALIFFDLGPSRDQSARQTRARSELKRFYELREGELKPYQIALRNAQLAYSTGDIDAERRAYRKVLVLLNSEDNNSLTGLTGSAEKDEELRNLIATILSR